MSKIEIPTLYLLHEDDPFSRMSFRKLPLLENPNVALATTKTGGHVASQEKICEYKLWLIEPAIKFLLAI